MIYFKNNKFGLGVVLNKQINTKLWSGTNMKHITFLGLHYTNNNRSNNSYRSIYIFLLLFYISINIKKEG